MSRLRRADAWIGKTLFHPPIIRLCQAIGYTQHRLHREMWFGWWLVAMWRTANDQESGWFAIALVSVVAFGMMVRAAITPDTEAGVTWLLFRIIWWTFLAINLVGLVLGEVGAGAPLRNLWLLVAEYAATITTIPPREDRKASRKMKEQEA